MNYLQRYQKQLGLTPDGVIGPKTAGAIMKDLGITDKLVFAHLMGQMAHESALYTNFRENLNYNEAGLLNIFRRCYKNRPDLVRAHAHLPVQIGNYVYANRNGNGPVESGDGYKYRGIFGLQLTGKRNILRFLKYAGLPPDTDLDSLKDQPRLYFLAGKFWFEDNQVNQLCYSVSYSCILNVSRKVNLGNNLTTAMPLGLAERE